MVRWDRLEMRTAYKNLLCSFRKAEFSQQNNIKIDLNKIWCDAVNGFIIKVQWQVVMDMEMQLQVP